MSSDSRATSGWWQPVLFSAMAGGMGWGIRGQYGHETGAMIPGLLVSLTLVFLLCPRANSLSAARAVAWGALAMGFGGSMTYGQTVGLTHDAPLIGNWAALRWGMLGLALKGGLWIGFAGVFLGMGMSGTRYRFRELLLLMLALVGVYYLGIFLLNRPFDPANRVLPVLYFSDQWHWEPDTVLTPRRECWGGLLTALTATVAYVGWWRKDRLARNLALWGVLAGAVGFPAGQSVQAFRMWNPDLFHEGLLARLTSHFNWWNMMETTFGAVMGGILGLGAWLNRRRIQPDADTRADRLSTDAEGTFVVAHVLLLVTAELLPAPAIQALYDPGLTMGILPIAAVAGGRWAPYLVTLPVILAPIAGKTVSALAYRGDRIGAVGSWLAYLIVPLALVSVAAFWFAKKSEAGQTGRAFTRGALLLCTWVYFFLNWAFFDFPWPWAEWTGRTPNGIVFAVCALGLTALTLTLPRISHHPPATTPQ